VLVPCQCFNLAAAGSMHVGSIDFYCMAVNHVVVAGAFRVGAGEGVCFNSAGATGMHDVSIYSDLEAALAAAVGGLHAAGPVAEMLFFKGPLQQFVLIFMLLSIMLSSTCCLVGVPLRGSLRVWSTLVLGPRRLCGCSCGLECPWCRPGLPGGAVAAWSARICSGGRECHCCRPGEPVGAVAAWRAG
jgi:hypothetical protein